MNKKGLSILFNNNLMVFIILLLFFKPIYFQYNSSLAFVENVFVYGKIFVAFLIVFDFLISSFPKMKINFVVVNIILFEIWILMVTFISEGNVFRSFINAVSSIVFTMYIIKGCLENKDKLIKIFKNTVFILVFIQLTTEIFYPNGMPADLYFNNQYNPLFFATVDNGTTSLVCLCLTLINLYYINNDNENNRGKIFLQNLICLLTAFFSGSSTAIICTVLMLLLFYLLKYKNNNFFEYGKFWIILYFCITFVLVSDNEFINNLFKLLTGKEGFTGRNFLWSNAIEMIKISPITGYGIGMHDHIRAWGGYFSSHNTILEILLEGGFVALSIWVVLMFQILKNIKKNINLFEKRILLVSLFVFLITLLMEASVHSVYLFSIMALVNAFYLVQRKI